MPTGDRRLLAMEGGLVAPRQRGFTLLTMLAALALVGLFLAVAGPAWAERSKREREDQLLRVGMAYTKAIRSYYLRSPGEPKQYPPTLEALIQDNRFIGMERHLRQLYPDPLAPAGTPWGLVRAPDGGIQGVYSTSVAPPLRQATVSLPGLALGPAKQYADWKFVPILETGS